MTISVLFGLLFIMGYVYSTHSDEALEQLIAQTFNALKFIALSFLAIAATTIYQTKLYTEKPVFSAVLCAVSAFYLFSAINLVESEQAFWVFLFIAAAYLGMSVYLLLEQLRVSNKELIVESKQEAELTLESLKDFQRWFKDDSIIKNKEELEQDLEVYANRITDRLRSGGDHEEGIAQHIALCGPFGCGKSSIVAAIANELRKSKKVEAELSDEEKLKIEQQNKINWIHSDISTWGAASGSVAHVVLSHIIDDISQHIDMCAFRALPKHYTEALKSGGSFFQFASTLLAGPVDIEQSFQKLNDVLEVTNHKILITLQDVDRGTGDENEKRLNDIAALLDRLKNKNLGQINFIIAMGNENDIAAEVISKATDYREDITQIDYSEITRKFIEESLVAAVNEGNILIIWDNLPKFRLEERALEDSYTVLAVGNKQHLIQVLRSRVNNLFNDEVSVLNSTVTSIRTLKKIFRRVHQSWQPDKLMGEVNFLSLVLASCLREVKPLYFQRFISNYDKFIKDKNKNINKFIDSEDQLFIDYFKVMLGHGEDRFKMMEEEQQKKPLLTALEEIANKLDTNKEPEVITVQPNELLKSTQSLACMDPTVDYLKRILNEGIQENELSEQHVFKRLMKVEGLQSLAGDFCYNLQFQRVVSRFEDILFGKNGIMEVTPTEKLYTAVIQKINDDYYTNGRVFTGIFSKMFVYLAKHKSLKSLVSNMLTTFDKNGSWDLISDCLDELRRQLPSRSDLDKKIETEEKNLLEIGELLLGKDVDESLLDCIYSLATLANYFKGGAGRPNFTFVFELILSNLGSNAAKLFVKIYLVERAKKYDRTFISAMKDQSLPKLALLSKEVKKLTSQGFSSQDIDDACKDLDSFR
ncbi:MULTISPECIES: ATP-binding protein [unclassified Pseudoalteromonas]|uniref:ATP-binding protein n=1 Tax=unclassified Pseudoalteromonas TaxID=194690 RepID=UPI0025B34266|nr:MULTISPECIES: ATP-binding protein [unclassified Pseudoalteromonas]MDN3378627.1 ATP-binding protein [Pseudoalteromonas sp. APC 3893]